MGREQLRELKAHLLELACHRSAESLAAILYRLPFEPYAPVRRQLLSLLRWINQARRAAGYADVPTTALRFKRQIVEPFSAIEPSVSLSHPAQVAHCQQTRIG